MIFQVRHADLTCIEQIQKVAMESWKSTYQNIFPLEFIESFIEKAYRRDVLERLIERCLQVRDRILLVAVDDHEEVIGFVQMNHIDVGCYELTRIYIHPSKQMRGIGKELLFQATTNFPDWEEVYAWVEQENKGGCKFYDHLGFVRIDQKEEIILQQPVKLYQYSRYKSSLR